MRILSSANFLVFLFLSMAFTKLFAQKDSVRSNALDEVIISASRQEQRILEVPRSVTVIGRDKIENSVYNSVGDLLAKQQGIYLVGANQTPGTNQSLFMRGANSNQVVVLMDGVRITDPSSPNNVIDLSELSLTNVERIEIIEGAHSTLYGGAAIGGVVNIITRKDQKSGLHGFAGLQAGTFGSGSSALSQQIDLNYNLSNGLYFNGSLFNQNVTGLNASIDTTRQGKTPDKDGFRKTDSYLKTGFRKNGWDVFVSFKNTSQRAEIDNGAFQDDDNDYVRFARRLWNYQLIRKLNDDWKISAIGSLSNSMRVNENDSSKINATQYDGSYSKSTYSGSLSTHEVQANYEIHHLKLVLGSGIFEEKMSFNTYFYASAFGGFESKTNYDSIQTKASTTYVFAQSRLQGGTENQLGISFGGRLSHHSLFGNYATWEISPSYAFTKSSLLFASMATGYNAPSLYQLFDPTQGFGSFTARGNSQLKPEESISLEIGYKKEFKSGSYVTTSLFNTQVRHAIEYIYLWNKNTSVDRLSYADYLGDTYVNITRQNVIGAELSGNAVFNSRLSVNGNLTWLQGQLKFSQNDLDQNKTGGHHVQVFSNGAFVNQTVEQNNLVRRPRTTAFAEARYRILKSTVLSTGYRLAGSRTDSAYDPSLGPFGALNQMTVKSYQLIDVGAKWQMSSWLSISLKLENLFNQKYQEISGYNTRGRSGYVKLNIKW